jgi:plastocyanin
VLIQRFAVGIAALLSLTTALSAQRTDSAVPHTIVVKLVDRGGTMPYAFDPPVVNAELGDTIRFTEAANVMHNVKFIKEPPGAKLGMAAVSPWLLKLGDTYTLVLDKRFVVGLYNYICEPHQMIGMKGTMIIAKRELQTTAR